MQFKIKTRMDKDKDIFAFGDERKETNGSSLCEPEMRHNAQASSFYAFCLKHARQIRCANDKGI